MKKGIILSLFLLSLCYSAIANKRDIEKIIELSNIWNIANNTQDYSKMNELFAEELVFYGVKVNVSECLQMKRNYFSNNEIFTQVIISDYSVTSYNEDIYKSTFTKKVTTNKKSRNYPAYLFFKKINGEFKIVEEGDEITNSNLNYVSDYDSMVNSEDNSWVLPTMVVCSSIGLLSIVFVSFKRKKRRLNSIVLPKPEILNVEERNMESIQKGREFEKYVVTYFDKNYFTIAHAQSDKSFDGRHVESNQNPDFVMRLETSFAQVSIAVECKYRSSINKNYPIQFCEEYQLKNYQRFGYENDMNVFLVLGVGGKPDNPDDLYVFPLLDRKKNNMSFNELKSYNKKPGTTFFYEISNEILR